MNSYTVIVRRWRDTRGNTYHSVSVWEHREDGIKALGRKPFTYGYGSQYEVTAFEIAKEHGYTGDVHDWKHDESILFSVSDVRKKSDL